MNEREKHLQRQNISLQRGFPEDKTYSFAFITGTSAVAEEATHLIAANYDNFIFPIDKIYLITRQQEGRFERAERIKRQAEQIAGVNTEVRYRSLEQLDEVFDAIDLAFITIDANPVGVYDRSKLSANNINALEQILNYFPSTITKNVNVISNLAEVLAPYLLTNLNFADPRLLTTNGPLDSIRAEQYFVKEVYNKLAKGFQKNIKDVTIPTAGFHDQMIPLLSAAHIITPWRNEQTGIYQENELKDYLENPEQFERELTMHLLECPVEEFELDNAYFQAKEDINRQVGSTIKPTGFATYEFAKAFVNHDETITGVLTNFEETWYFQDGPVSFRSGIAEENKSAYTPSAREQVKQRIMAEPKEGLPKSLATIIAETEIATDKNLQITPTFLTQTELSQLFGKPLPEKHTDKTIVKRRAEKDLEESLKKNMNFDLLLLADRPSHKFKRCSFNKGVNPGITEFYISIPDDPDGYEQSRTTIQSLAQDKKFTYALTIRKRNDNSATYRIQQFPKANGYAGRDIFMTTIDNYFEHDFNNLAIINDTPYLIEDSIQGAEIIRIKKGKKETITRLKQSPINTYKYKNTLLIDMPDAIKIIQGKKETCIDGIINANNSFFAPLTGTLYRQQGNFITPINVENLLVGASMQAREARALFANNQGVQTISSVDGSLIVSNYTNKKGQLIPEQDYFITEKEITQGEEIIIPSRNVIISLHSPDEAYAMYHTSNEESFITTIPELTNFSTKERKIELR